MVGNNKIVFISQVYPPDPAAVGQYIADVAEEMAKRNWNVTVLSASSGYDDSSLTFPKYQISSDVKIKRFPYSSFGKTSITLRILAGLFFILQSFIYCVRYKDIKCLFISTSPPFSSLVALGVRLIRRVKIVYWVMDINPDQMAALGKTSNKSFVYRAFDYINMLILKKADIIITLDAYMADRLKVKANCEDKIEIVSLWPLKELNYASSFINNKFRSIQKLNDKKAIMYSGNHSMANPLDTLLKAATSFKGNDAVAFVFVGGGVQKSLVDKLLLNNDLGNIISVPYQTLDNLQDTLSAADVHVVSVGNGLAGIVHPSKIYGAMAVGRPIISLGPDNSYIASLVKEHRLGWHVNHDDVNGIINIIEEILSLSRNELDTIGLRGYSLVKALYNRDELLKRVCDIIESKSP